VLLAAGYDFVQGDINAVALNVNNIDFSSGGPYIRLGYDSLDNIHFPTEGPFLLIKYQNSDEQFLEINSKSGKKRSHKHH